jgi:tRNA nucleotidyltransferase (CCA-adding enzyme)
MNAIHARPAPDALTAREAVGTYEHVLPVLDRLAEEGFEAYLVGGGVRDLLLDRRVEDWDVATSAPPEAVLGLWPKAVPTGLRHGTVTLRGPAGPLEVTTFRTEGSYSDGRRPDWVNLDATLEEDLARRDFTVNAMAFDPARRLLIDPQGGLQDLEARRLRTVGDAEQRFAEDGLRPLRGIRLAAVLELTIDGETLAAMGRAREKVAGVAPERVRGELMKLMAAPKPSVGVELLRRTGLLELVLPEILEGRDTPQNRFHAYDVYEHSLRTLDRAPGEKPLVRLAALLHDVAKPRTRRVVDGEGTFYDHQLVGAEMARDILDRLRFSRAERDRVIHLVREHLFHYTEEWSDAAVRRFLRRVGPENVEDLFDLRVADDHAHGTGKDSSQALKALAARIRAIRERDEAIKVEDLAVGGDDVMAELGLASGPKVGRVLNDLLEQVLEHPQWNTRERLLALMRERHRSS